MISDEGNGRRGADEYIESVIVAALKQVDAGQSAADIGREVGVSVHTIYAWKAKYGGRKAIEAQEACDYA